MEPRFRVTAATSFGFVVAMLMMLWGLTGCTDQVTNNYLEEDVSTYILTKFKTETGIVIQGRHRIEVKSLKSGDVVTVDTLYHDDTLFTFFPAGGIAVETRTIEGARYYIFNDTIMDAYDWTDARFEYQYFIGRNPKKAERQVQF